MLYRFATIGIVGFWLVMMALLVRIETHPENTDILNIPTSYVGRIMFRHGQLSLLAIRQEDRNIGTLSLRPSITGSNTRALDFSGSLSTQVPLSKYQRVNFHGVLDMDIGMNLLDFQFELNIQEPRYRLDAEGNIARKTINLDIHDRDSLIASESLPMNASAIGPAILQSLGLPANTQPVTAAGITPPAINARETQIVLHGETIQVYEIALTEGSTPVAEFYVTQLGQLVLAKSNFGYTLVTEEFR